jgi:NAD(P)-dependent dehydrogenase (short-subunit alcohol dehydrogenase family)
MGTYTRAVRGALQCGETTHHPHTNMAKAALNMMTRASSAELHGDGIHMNSVDTGWVSDEDAASIAVRKQADHRFHPAPRHR